MANSERNLKVVSTWKLRQWLKTTVDKAIYHDGDSYRSRSEALWELANEIKAELDTRKGRWFG